MPAALPLAGLEFINKGFTLFESQLTRAERLEAKLVDTSKTVAAQSIRTSRSLGVMGVALGAVGGILLGVTTSLARHGMELERSAIATETVARVTGVAAETLARERRELDDMMVPVRQTNDMLSRFALNQLDVASASDLATAALDLSTLSTRSGSRAVQDFTNAVITQNLMQLKAYGVMTQTTKIYKWYGAQIDKTVKQLTALERSQAIQNYLVTIASGLQGAYNRLLETAAGQMEIFDFRISKISDTLATLLMPRVNAVIQFINGLLERIQALPAPVQRAIVDIMSLGGVILSAAGAITLLAPGLKILWAGFKALPAVVGSVVASIVGLHPAILILGGAITALVAGIATDFGGLRGLFDQTFGGLVESLRNAYTESVPWVKAIGSLIWDGLTAAFQAADRFIRTLTGGLVKDDWGFEFDAERFFVGGASIMGEFAAGLIRGFNEYVLPTVISIVKVMSAFLGGSLPTEGPLADIRKSGLEIIQEWSHGMGDASLKEVRKLVKEVAEELQQAAYLIQDALFDVETLELDLEKALWPFVDALFLAQAAADLITIPLQQQQRVLESEIEDLEKIAALERERAEEYLKQLQKQADMMKEIIDADEERLEVLDHEIFMETQRNKILGRATSARLLELKSQKMAMQDTVDVNKESLEATEGQISAEEERLDALTTAAEAQIEALQAQIDIINESIEFEEERVRLAEEALRMEEARQAAAQLALLEERRFWEIEQRMASHYLDIISRVPKEQKKRKKGLEDFIDTWDKWEPKPFVAPIDVDKAVAGLEGMKQKLLDAFWGPIEEQLKETDRLLLELRDEWSKLEYEFKIKFVWPTPREIGANVATLFLDLMATLGYYEVEVWLPWIASLPQKLLDALTLLGYWEVEVAWPWLLETREKVRVWADEVGGTFRTWVDGIHEDVDEFAAGFNEVIDKELLQPAKEAFLTWYNEQKETVTTWASEQLEIVKEWALDVWTEYSRFYSDLATGTVTWIAEQIERFVAFYDNLRADLVLWVAETITYWVTMLVDLVTETVKGLFRLWDLFWTWLHIDMYQIWLDAKRLFIEWINAVWDDLEMWFVETGIPEMIQHGIDTIAEFVGAAVKWIEDFPQKIENIGEGLVIGIWKGIKNKWDWIHDKVASFVKSLIRTAKEKLHIVGDPVSMVFKGIGDTLATSLGTGWMDAMKEVVPEMSAQLDVSRRAQEWGVGSTSTVTNNYITNEAPSFRVDANYAKNQSEASIRDDLRMMMMLA